MWLFSSLFERHGYTTVTILEDSRIDEVLLKIFLTKATSCGLIDVMKTFHMSEVEKICGLKRTRLQQWIERGWIGPSIQRASGAGTRNVFSEYDLIAIIVFRKAVEAGLLRESVAEFVSPLMDSLQGMSLRGMSLRDLNQPIYILFFRLGREVVSAELEQFSITSIPYVREKIFTEADDLVGVNLTKIVAELQKEIGYY